MADSDESKRGKVIPIKGRRCPVCGQGAIETYRPFCSKRCADRDLDQWLTGGYSIPTEDEGDFDDEPPEDR